MDRLRLQLWMVLCASAVVSPVAPPHEARRRVVGTLQEGTPYGLRQSGSSSFTLLRINELEAERRAIEARLPSRDADEVRTLHPRTAERYKQRVADIHTALSKGDKAAREAVELVRELIDRIVVTPTDDGEPMKLELVGNVAALLEEQPLNGGAIVAVAGPATTFVITR